MVGVCGVQKSQEAYAYQGLCQDWQPVIKIVRTVNQGNVDGNGWVSWLTHNQETIIVRKQLQLLGRK